MWVWGGKGDEKMQFKSNWLQKVTYHVKCDTKVWPSNDEDGKEK